MCKPLYRLILFLLTITVFTLSPIQAQDRSGTISGTVRDAAKGVLPGARIVLQPTEQATVSNAQGQFTIANLSPGQYTLTVSYVGFSLFSTGVTVTAGQAARVDAVLQVAGNNEVVVVSGARQRGEVEAINIERTADNIVQVLPADVIISLPNTNIADAVGRLPSVSLERDEGEGKYIQIRGTEPRLSNVTIDGIHVPSPENVRNVKLDVVPSDLVEAIEVNKTLAADQDADAIGGSVNLVTKSAGDRPYLSVLGMGGYTPIDRGRTLDQFALTGGDRFGPKQRFGILLGVSYDHNNRGIDDIEPAYDFLPLPNGATFQGPDTVDIRQYLYNRTRYGLDGALDYKLGDMSSIYLRGLFSRFHDFGQDWIYSPAISNFVSDPNSCNPSAAASSFNGPTGCGGLGFTDVYRQPSQQIFDVQAGARHPVGTALLNYTLALSQSKALASYPRASFDGPGASDSSVAFGVDTSHPFTPKFPVLNGVNIYDPGAYTLSRLSFQNDNTFERDVAGNVSLNKPYNLGDHYGAFEVGLKAWDARKTQLYGESSFNADSTLLMSSFLSSYRNPDYYLGRITAGPTTDYNKILAYFNDNPGQFTGGFNPVRSYPNDFDISERIWGGYVMNTIGLGKLRLQAGLRIEATGDSLLGTVVTLDSNGDFAGLSPLRASHNYTNVFPSMQAQYALTPETVVRAAYGMGIARPNFGDIAPYVLYDPTSSNTFPVSAGNPDLKPTHAQNFDLLIERYLKPVGLIQFGGFYKYLTDPIYTVGLQRTVEPYAGFGELIPVNGPRAHVGGIEMTWQQQLRFLPGLLNGTGVRANYSYTTSRASFPSDFGRTDHPSLLRQAPNNWNVDVTYDKRGISARMGLTHNDAYIWSYAGSNARPTAAGDTYLYPHTQVDAQVSYWIPRGHGLQAIASMLNLNNEVFGFYNGGEQFPIQREYYSRTISLGLRWTLPQEPK
jgi:TonB-dependent receptor